MGLLAAQRVLIEWPTLKDGMRAGKVNSSSCAGSSSKRPSFWENFTAAAFISQFLMTLRMLVH